MSEFGEYCTIQIRSTHSLGCFLSLVLCVTREAGIFNPFFFFFFFETWDLRVQSTFNENKILPYEHKKWGVRNMCILFQPEHSISNSQNKDYGLVASEITSSNHKRHQDSVRCLPYHTVRHDNGGQKNPWILWLETATPCCGARKFSRKAGQYIFV